ncbi:DNA-directed RNA polymerase I, subunit RPA34.5 [Mycotypha africana]|uniref:DNA-directed RNA polymerase I, subunit RPA34.5 n=1 Tax=Mycotypha africana TaxID=64632 RepID=UPI002300DFB3|nr:DNA-directed RNA polymerase I, subunit RPA34.5 [Mycotypha africana]KAI8979461.1 DNA-directed RNA polymerase I, subunit RPA34.5 [Mycotypha africana]
MIKICSLPEGFKEALSKFDSPFDKESVVDDDKELWLIRIPDNLTEEDVANMAIHLPADTTKASKKPLCQFQKSSNKYALYTVPTEDTASDMPKEDEAASNEETQDLGISGHEMLSFDCLLPSREENGRFVFAPKTFDKYLILNQEVDIPDTTILAQSILEKPVYKREQPEGLKMRYKPYGYYSGEPITAADKMETSDNEEPKSEETTEAGQKRQIDEEQPNDKAAKKAKKEKKDKKDKKKKDKKEKK